MLKAKTGKKKIKRSWFRLLNQSHISWNLKELVENSRKGNPSVFKTVTLSLPQLTSSNFLLANNAPIYFQPLRRGWSQALAPEWTHHPGLANHEFFCFWSIVVEAWAYDPSWANKRKFRWLLLNCEQGSVISLWDRSLERPVAISHLEGSTFLRIKTRKKNTAKRSSEKKSRQCHWALWLQLYLNWTFQIK